MYHLHASVVVKGFIESYSNLLSVDCGFQLHASLLLFILVRVMTHQRGKNSQQHLRLMLFGILHSMRLITVKCTI